MGETLDKLRSEMDSAIRSGCPNLVLDFTEVTGIDSSAIGVLIRGLTQAQGSGGGIRLAGVSQHVLNSLRLTALLRLFSIHPTVESAIASFQSGDQQPAK